METQSTARGGRAARRAAGFTLIELVVSATVMAILLVAIGSAMVLASRAIPDADSVVANVNDGAAGLDQLHEELQYALHVTERTATAITIVIDDRDGDGRRETTRYHWSGTAGDPLTRQVNGGAIVNVVDSVNDFQLSYTTDTQTTTLPGPVGEGLETRLAAYNPASPAKLSEYKIDKNAWPGQFVNPTLPADAIGYRVTRLRLRLRDGGGNSETIGVRLQAAAAGGLPDGNLLDESLYAEVSLDSNAQWTDLPFNSAPILTPTTDLTFLVTNATGSGVAGKVDFDEQASSLGGNGLLETTDTGASYSRNDNMSLLYEAFGTTITEGTPQTLTRTFITGAHVRLRVINDDDAALDSFVQFFNRPESTATFWAADFETDPTAIDHNGDGANDFAMTYGGAFDTGTLIGGVWQINDLLRVNPDAGFTQPTLVNLRWRDTSTTTGGATFTINADWAGDDHALIVATLERQLNDTQTLTVMHYIDAVTSRTLATINNLPLGFADTQLIIDPTLDTVTVSIAGVTRGTYRYATFTASAAHYAEVSGASGSEIDELEIRVLQP